MTIDSELPLLGAPDDFVLQRFAKVVEIIAVAGNTDDEVAVFFRMLLRIAKRIGRHNVELDMMTVHPEIAPDQL